MLLGQYSLYVSNLLKGSQQIDEINALLRGETIVRQQSDDPPLDGKGRSSVPKAGSRKQQEDDDPDLAAEPQPGS